MFKKLQLLLGILVMLAFSTDAFAAQNTLSWTNAVDSRITGTRVERKPGSCTSTGTWTKIGSIAVGVSTYADLTVVEGQTYSYRVRHAAEVDVFSAYSNCASRTVPISVLGAPPAPSNLQIN